MNGVGNHDLSQKFIPSSYQHLTHTKSTLVLKYTIPLVKMNYYAYYAPTPAFPSIEGQGYVLTSPKPLKMIQSYDK